MRLFTLSNIFLLFLLGHCLSIPKEQKKIIDTAIKNSFNKINLEEFERLARQDDVITVDTRDVAEVPRGFVPNSILIPLDLGYYWFSRIISPDQKIILITRRGKEKESIAQLAKNGLVNILGYLEGGFDAWKKSGRAVSQIDSVEVAEAMEKMSSGETIALDVREKSEWESGVIIPNSVLMSLNNFKENIQTLLNHLHADKNKEVYLFCKTGPRTVIAISVLKKYGCENRLITLEGGLEKLEHSGYKFVKYSSSDKSEL